jgi:hypothetical protein
MDAARMALLIPIFSTLGLFLLIFGIVYLRNKEKMAMIERGMDPRIQIDNAGSRNYVLTSAMLLIGSGVGLFLAFMLDRAMLQEYDNAAPIYFAMITFFGGLGLLTAYMIEKKEAKKQ